MMDDEFEPTVDMMVNDFDDEGTLDEAEADETAEQQKIETDLLKKEQDIPIEKLLEMYGGGRAALRDDTVKDEEEEEDDQADEDESLQSSHTDGDEQSESQSPSADSHSAGELSHSVKKERSDEASTSSTPVATGDVVSRGHKRRRSALSVLYPELTRKSAALEAAGGSGNAHLDASPATSTGTPGDRRALRSEDGLLDEVDELDCSDGEAESSDESSWRKTIMIGSVYQAQVPDGLSPYGDSRPYENDDKLLWQPSCISASAVEDFLRRVQQARLKASSGIAVIPNGAHTRDHEEALYVLQQCNHNAEEAFRRSQMNSHQPSSTMSLWSEEECASFENGLRFYGKDFYMIQQQKVRTRSVGELVQFYYLWKKTERHDVFANKTKLEKRKYALNPGVTDYMERFIEEQDREASSQSRVDASSSDSASLQILLATDDVSTSGSGWCASSTAVNSTVNTVSLVSGAESTYQRKFAVDSSLSSSQTAALVPP